MDVFQCLSQAVSEYFEVARFEGSSRTTACGHRCGPSWLLRLAHQEPDCVAGGDGSAPPIVKTASVQRHVERRSRRYTRRRDRGYSRCGNLQMKMLLCP